MTLLDVGLAMVVAFCIWFYWKLERAGRRQVRKPLWKRWHFRPGFRGCACGRWVCH